MSILVITSMNTIENITNITIRNTDIISASTITKYEKYNNKIRTLSQQNTNTITTKDERYNNKIRTL